MIGDIFEFCHDANKNKNVSITASLTGTGFISINANIGGSSYIRYIECNKSVGNALESLKKDIDNIAKMEGL